MIKKGTVAFMISIMNVAVFTFCYFFILIKNDFSMFRICGWIRIPDGHRERMVQMQRNTASRI